MIALLVITGTLVALILIARLVAADGRVRARPVPSGRRGQTWGEHVDQALAITREPAPDWRSERYPDSRPLMDDTLRQIEIAELEALYERAPRDPRRPPIIPGQPAPSTEER